MSTSLSKDIPVKTTNGVRIESPVHVNLAINNPKKVSGRKKFHETRHPVLRGIRCRGTDKKWVCELRLPDNKKGRIWLGSYDTTEMAARAHDVGAIALLGPKACLNFEDSLWLLPIPTSMDPIDIKKAAHLAAEAFRPKTMEMDPTQVQDEDENEDEDEEDALPPTADFEWLDEEEDTADFEWLDEERMLMDDMADGLMIPRPHYTSISDDSELVDDVPLWSFSV